MIKNERQFQWEDEQLKSTTFLITDPEAQDGLVRVLPPGTQLVRIVNVYQAEGWPDRKVWCARCRAHRHKNGFTAEVSNGSRVTTGSKCGADLFGVSWNRETKAFEARRRRRDNLLWADRARSGLPGVIRSLAAWREPVQAAADAHRRLAITFPRIEEALYASDDGALTVYERVAKEIRSGGPGWREVRMGRVGGTPFLTANPRIDAQLKNVLASLKRVHRELTSKRSFSDTELRRFRNYAGSRRMVQISNLYAEAQKFFSSTSFGQIAPWATKQALADDIVVYGDGRLICKDGQSFRLPLLPALSKEPNSLMDAISSSMD